MPGAAIADNVLSPSQLNALARSLLEDAFPVVLVEGEIGNLARPASGHIYLTLKDARAQVRCAQFKPKSQRLRLQPRDGIRGLARGRLQMYEATGAHQKLRERRGGDGGVSTE